MCSTTAVKHLPQVLPIRCQLTVYGSGQDRKLSPIKALRLKGGAQLERSFPALIVTADADVL
jgi:hypothetical protein